MRSAAFLSYLSLCLTLFPVHSWAMASRPPVEPTAPAFPKAGVWLNSRPLDKTFFEKKVTLVYFWDYTSLNCLRDLVFLKHWHEAYHANGFQILLIHAPEFPFAREKQNVEKALERYKIHEPVFLDNDFTLWTAYKIYAWPSKVLVDSKGVVRLVQAGEGQYVDTEQKIRKELFRMNPDAKLPEPVVSDEPAEYDSEVCGSMTAETYIGYKRAHWWGGEVANRNWTKPDETTVFKDRGDRVQRGFFLHGLWKNGEDHFEHARQTKELKDYLGLLYYGNQIFAVLQSSNPAPKRRVYITRDDAPVPLEKWGTDVKEDDLGTYVEIDAPRLYQFIQNEDEEQHEIKLWAKDLGVSINSFSFSNSCLSQIEFL